MSSREPKLFKIVVKIGGSLLLRPNLGTAFENWLDLRLGNRRLHTQVNLIIGGGAIVDAFRQLDAIHSLDPVSLHWQCVDALRHTSEIIARLIPNCVVIDSTKSFNSHKQSATAGRRFVIIPDVFYNRSSDACLPCDWSTTSDSIAGLLANKIGADHLVLLKSCDIPQNMKLNEAARCGIVDPVLPTIIDENRVEIVKLP